MHFVAFRVDTMFLTVYVVCISILLEEVRRVVDDDWRCLSRWELMTGIAPHLWYSGEKEYLLRGVRKGRGLPYQRKREIR
jgi:hypothetical protein